MTQEEKNLLLKDLCGRLPYVTYVRIIDPTCLDKHESVTEGCVGGYSSTRMCQDYSMDEIFEFIESGGTVKSYLPLLPNNEDEYLYGARVNGGKWMINDAYYVDEIRPYLRPMSSMTEDEKKEFESLGWRVDDLDNNTPWIHNTYNVFDGVDWLNANHFDYRGLIPMGLALPATEGMYDIKTK